MPDPNPSKCVRFRDIKSMNKIQHESENFILDHRINIMHISSSDNDMLSMVYQVHHLTFLF